MTIPRNLTLREPNGHRALIINADDFGLSDGVTAGIIRAWRDGVVTSTTALINIDGAADRVLAADAAYPELPIGLHLNITTGKPVLAPEQVPSLVNPMGCFFETEAVFARFPEIKLAELRAELWAQADLMIRCGVMFDHLDYHQHLLALYAPFYHLVRELAAFYQVPVRQPVPAKVNFGGIPKGADQAVRRIVKFVLQNPRQTLQLVPHVTPAAQKRQAALLVAEGLATTDWFVPSYYGRASLDHFTRVINQLPMGVSEMMVHPGEMDAGLRHLGGGYVDQRPEELAVLVDVRAREALAAQEIDLVDFSYLQNNSRQS